jgi:hypothetical protein
MGQSRQKNKNEKPIQTDELNIFTQCRKIRIEKIKNLQSRKKNQITVNKNKNNKKLKNIFFNLTNKISLFGLLNEQF